MRAFTASRVVLALLAIALFAAAPVSAAEAWVAVGSHVIDNWGWIVLIAGCIGAAVGASTITSQYAADGDLLYPALIPCLVMTFVAALFARAAWSNEAWQRVMRRFKRKEVPRLYEELNRQAARLSSAG